VAVYTHGDKAVLPFNASPPWALAYMLAADTKGIILWYQKRSVNTQIDDIENIVSVMYRVCKAKAGPAHVQGAQALPSGRVGSTF
jgi:hypothetical protein